MGDQDGNFIKDFQSNNGFYNRLWELYLFNVFVECRFIIVEDWKEGVTIFHNPNAVIKLNKNLFKSCKQIWVEEDEFNGEIPEFYPYNSITGTINKKDMIPILEKEEPIKSTSEEDLRKLLSDDKLKSIVFGTNE
jgi:hypothetical protein